jgi:chemotaxis protein histidine kinase CheA
VIDSLDDHKKGTSHMNMQARESIRFLDQKLLESSNRAEAPTTSYLRTQKVTEKLADWSDAQAYWIGEESRSNVVDNLLSDEDEDEEPIDSDAKIESDVESTSSNEDLFKARRGDDSDQESDMDTSEEEVSSEEDASEQEEEEYAYNEQIAEEDEDEDKEDEDAPYTLDDVPKMYRPIISCLLYYHSKQQAKQDDHEPERLVLVTNDDDLAWWAELFGNPNTGKRLLIKTVNEWDQMVSKLDFEKVYDYSWKHR